MLARPRQQGILSLHCSDPQMDLLGSVKPPPLVRSRTRLNSLMELEYVEASLQQVRQRQHSGRLLIESLQQMRQGQHSGRVLMEMKVTEAGRW